MSDADKRVCSRDSLIKFLREQGHERAAKFVEGMVRNEEHMAKSCKNAWEAYNATRARLDVYEPRHNTWGKPSPESDG
jgi:hypothetical protein